MQMILVAGGWVHHSLPKKKKKRAHCHAQTFLLCASFTFSPASVFFSSCCLIAKRCNTLPLHCHHWFKKNSPILPMPGFFVFVCLSVCLSVRPFARLTLRLYTSCSFFPFFLFLWKCFGKILFVNREVIRGRFVGI